jgi:uncharacterized protein YdaU (DUF1376 family)
MRLHVGDYLADTMHLSALQHGIYLLLIMHYFKRGDLPNDPAALRRIAKVSARQWRANASPVVALFRPTATGSLCHPRIDHERAIAAALSETRREAGKRGAASKWGWQMPSDAANNSDGKSHVGARPRARDSHNHLPKNPPRSPPDNGGGRAARNAMLDITVEEIAANAESSGQQGAPVVQLPRRSNRG